MLGMLSSIQPGCIPTLQLQHGFGCDEAGCVFHFGFEIFFFGTFRVHQPPRHWKGHQIFDYRDRFALREAFVC